MNEQALKNLYEMNAALDFLDLMSEEKKTAYLNEILKQVCLFIIWRPPSLCELTPIIYNMELTHLGFEAFIYYTKLQFKKYTFISKNIKKHNYKLKLAVQSNITTIYITMYL